MSRYSFLKALKYPVVLQAIRDHKHVPPVHVQMILSDYCNQSCSFCAYRDPGYTSSQMFHVEGNYNPKRMMHVDKALEILDDCAQMGVKAIQFTGGGEPTVHPKFDEITAYTSKLGLQWAIVTNGVVQRDLSNATWIRVSLDAATAGTYSKIRRIPENQFARACETIKKYKTGVGFVVTPDNWKEVYDAAALAKSLGASNIKLGAQFTDSGTAHFASFGAAAADLCKEAEKLSDDTFQVHNRFAEKMNDLEQGRPDYETCGYQRFTTYVGADLNVYRCCATSYNERGLLGSIKNKRFKDLWSEISFDGFKASGCVRCQFNSINRIINEVTTPDESEAFV